MARRKTTIVVEKANQIRAAYVRGMSDVAFKGFACLNPSCTGWIFVPEDEIGSDFEIICPTCGFLHKSGEESIFYDYRLVNRVSDREVERGSFGILMDDYVGEAGSYKYCIVCNALKPVAFFDRHSARQTKRQGECRLCKRVYNDIKNQTRTSDQHREAAQRRRFYLDLTGSGKIDSKTVYERFDYKCFKCGVDLRNAKSEHERPLDHTLPASYLWPLGTQNSTLLCRIHNAEKAGKWPSEYYSEDELKRLSVKTGWPLALLRGRPVYNPEVLERLKDPRAIDAVLTRYAAYIPDISRIRNKILSETGVDIFVRSSLSRDWIDRADAELHSRARLRRKPKSRDR